MLRKIFRIFKKEDSPEKLAAVEGVEPKYYQSAEELNTLADAGIYAIMNALNATITWSDAARVDDTNLTYLELILKIHNQWLREEVDEVAVYIERYKPKRKPRLESFEGNEFFIPGVQYKKSGFRHDKSINLLRPSVIIIDDTKIESILRIGQEEYFKHSINDSNRIGVKGGKFQRYNFKPTVYLQFKIRVQKNGTYYYSNPFCKLKMFVKQNHIHYKNI